MLLMLIISVTVASSLPSPAAEKQDASEKSPVEDPTKGNEEAVSEENDLKTAESGYYGGYYGGFPPSFGYPSYYYSVPSYSIPSYYSSYAYRPYSYWW